MDKYTKHRFFTALVLEIRASLYSTPSDSIFISKFSPFSEPHTEPSKFNNVLKTQYNFDSQIAVYYHPCNQNADGPLKQEEIGRLTFVIVSKLFLANRPIPSCLF